ncbi:hypothetical protein [Aeromicrobium sp. 50.2.37]|jgi:hypothetical protein|uniref:hypothetical protein n=1 Tax=Aeromicrobium sp. 50.2.37 TaxID=2969305 RepID=UPI00214F9333|nr:hypothetical protein [Aeromicrobium sp. 50.2.37]MCR4511738.1 hypothetical protein [Aeromicrobium sp. 50.2.37]
MTTDKIRTPFATANALDQLTVRVLIANPETALKLEAIEKLVAEHGNLRGRGAGATFQRTAAAAITYRRNFTLATGWTFAGANVTAGLMAWQKLDTDELIIDRLCSRGVTSFGGTKSVPLTSGTLLRVCDLTNPDQSVAYTSDNVGWLPADLPMAGVATVTESA